MSKTFFANATGVIIYEGDESQLSQFASLADDPDLTVPGALTAIEKLNYLYFHSGYSYLGRAVKATTTIYHPARTASSSPPGSKHANTTYNLIDGTSTYNITSHNKGGGALFITELDGDQLLQGMPIQNVGASTRAVCSVNDGSNINIYETYMTHSQSLPAITKTYTVYLFDFLTTAAVASETDNLEITPTSLKAGKGKMNTDFGYIRREATNPDFYLCRTATGDLEGGKLKAIAPSGKVTFNPVMPSPAWSYRINVYGNIISQVNVGDPLYEGSFGGASTSQGTTISGWPAAGNGTGVKL